MAIVLRIIVLITLSLLGGLLYSLTANFLIMANMMPVDSAGGSFGYEMTSKAVFVWIGSVGLGIISLFMQSKWRYALLLCPLLAPALFSFLFVLSQ